MRSDVRNIESIAKNVDSEVDYIFDWRAWLEGGDGIQSYSVSVDGNDCVTQPSGYSGYSGHPGYSGVSGYSGYSGYLNAEPLEVTGTCNTVTTVRVVVKGGVVDQEYLLRCEIVTGHGLTEGKTVKICVV